MSQQPQRRRRRRSRPAARQNTGQGEGAERGASGGRASDGGARSQPPRRTIFGLPRMSFAILAGLLVALIAMFGMQLAFPPSDVVEIRGVVSYPDQGRRHLEEGEQFLAYNSSPPTSGPHHDAAPRAGIYGADEPAPFNEIPDPAQMLPLLESGGVVVYYDPDHPITAELLLWLRTLANVRLNLSAVPLEGLAALHDGAPIAAAAWRTLLPLLPPSDDDDDDDGPPAYRTQLEDVSGAAAKPATTSATCSTARVGGG